VRLAQRRMLRSCASRVRSALVIALAAVTAAGCGSSRARSHPATAAATAATTHTQRVQPPVPAPRHVPSAHATLARWRLPVARYRTMAAANGRYIFLLGGIDASGATVDTVFGGEYTGTFSRAIQRVDLSSGRATIVGRLPTSYAHAMATVRDGQVFVLGGSTPAGASSAILRFDPATGAVSRAGTLPEHVADGGIATIGETTYVIGGISATPLTTVCIVRIG
jgi:hypothetical protein